MAEIQLLVLRTHQALWSKKRGYGLKEDGSVIEFSAPAGASPTMYFGSLMNNSKIALSGGHCFGVVVDSNQVGPEVSRPLNSEQAGRLFQKTIWMGEDSNPTSMDAEEMQLVIGVGKTF